MKIIITYGAIKIASVRDLYHFPILHCIEFYSRTSSHEEETLDDIFNSPSKPSFTITEDDEDLFKQTSAISEPAVQNMSADDIASYIQQNMPDTDAKLDLF